MEAFKLASGTDLLHVPYKGAAPSVAAVVAGEVQAAILALPPLLPQVRAGKVRTIAVTSPKRSASLPDVPTMAEIGYPDAGADNWFGALVPAATPKELREKLHSIFVKAFETPETKKYMAMQGVDVMAGSPEEFAAFLKSEYAKWQKVIKATGIKAE
jgi:tripartite-type tricarboxylate transporter receptor subunit TctC